MKIEYWEGGLQRHEVKAIEKIEKAFSPSDKKAHNPGASIEEQLKNTVRHFTNSWKGYAGFRFADARGNEGEFDLLIVTHRNIVIVELKNWNNGEIISSGDKWYKNNQDMGRSPVTVTRSKVYAIKNKLEKYKNQLSNKKYVPWIDFLVVMTGNVDFSKISQEELSHTLSISDFLRFSDKQAFDEHFTKNQNTKFKPQDFKVFNEIFTGNHIKPKHLTIAGYKATDLIFDKHPKKVYREYQAVSEQSKDDLVLLRVWNFDNLDHIDAKTPDGRYKILSREREVLQFIKNHDQGLYDYCLRSLRVLQKEEITSEYSEIYELPPNHFRFNEFIGKFCEPLAEKDRINIVKLLIAKFAELHEIKIAHRDLGDHSIWIAPSKRIALSTFISAYHQPIGTVGDYRNSLSVNEGLTPKGMNVDKQTTSFQMDVYSLGLLAWHILQAKRLTPKSTENLAEKVKESQAWYAPIISKALGGKEFANAKSFFDALYQAEPGDENQFEFDNSELEEFITPINHSRKYKENSELICETSEKEVYESGKYLVKAWLNISTPIKDSGIGYQVLHFLQKVENLRNLSLPYIPTIHDFGIAAKSSSLYVVSYFIQGQIWSELSIATEKAFVLIDKLISVIEHLHELNIAHGDLHPENIKVIENQADFEIYLLDLPDFSLSTKDIKNHRYSPENIDSCTPFERDNFAVMRMSCELLGLEWGKSSDEYPHITEAINTELQDKEFGFKELSRFKDSLKGITLDTESIPSKIEISVKGDFEPLTIYPDNGRLYLQIEPNLKNKQEARLKFIGLGGIFECIFSPEKQDVVVGFPPKHRNSINFRDIDESQLEFDFCIQIKSDSYYNLESLSKQITQQDSFIRAIDTCLFKYREDSDIEEELPYFEPKSDADSQKLSISTPKLWQAILDTETESLPYIEIYGDIREPKDLVDQVILPYKSETDVLEQYRKDDIIEALLKESEKETFLGTVNLKHSSTYEVRLENLKIRAKKLIDGNIVYFRTKQDKASFQKRKNALKRILNKESVTPNLIDYFDPSIQETPRNYNISITEEGYAKYDRTDDQGNAISLNPQQRKAFQQLLQSGPLSLLQGPPGTGKTEFIAAFVHFLIENNHAKNILILSQSHEAVNTAAERIRKHCQRLNTNLEIVRFSNRENAVSLGLRDVYSNALITEKRELFKAEIVERIRALSQALGLDAEYLSELVYIELKLFKKITTLLNFDANNKNSDFEKDNKRLKSELWLAIKQDTKDRFDFEPDINDLSELKQKLSAKLQTDYAIRPDEAKKATALVKISTDMLDVLETENVNYDEFFARSRQLVTGTCVGIGQWHIGIHQNQYDWVIIDEAARSIASELAIGMQSAKRILLVGDHKQLAPLYSDEHKKVLARKLGIASKDEEFDQLLKSDFEQAFAANYGVSLLTQYRMAEPIGNLVSECFYEGNLENGGRKIPAIYNGVSDKISSVVTWLDTSTLGQAAHHQQENNGTSIYNRREADEIIKILEELHENTGFIEDLSNQVNENEAAIGIICMYGAQKQLLRHKFKEKIWTDTFKSLVKIDTVDSYQGKENRIIILSITRFDKKLPSGFLKIPNRINVALSRAMDRLIIIGATEMWRSKNVRFPLGKVIDFIENKISQAQTNKTEEYKIIQLKKESK